VGLKVTFNFRLKGGDDNEKNDSLAKAIYSDNQITVCLEE